MGGRVGIGDCPKKWSDVGRPSPLRVVPFPRQGTLNCMSRAVKLSIAAKWASKETNKQTFFPLCLWLWMWSGQLSQVQGQIGTVNWNKFSSKLSFTWVFYHSHRNEISTLSGVRGLHSCCWRRWSQHANPGGLAPEHELLSKLCVVTTAHKSSKTKLKTTSKLSQKDDPPGYSSGKKTWFIPNLHMLAHNCL